MTSFEIRPLTRQGLLALLVAAVVSLICVPAWARVGGIAAEGCSGCHGGTGDTTLTLSTNPETFQPSSEIEVLLSVNGSGIAAAGVFITTKGVGSLEPLSGQGLTKVNNGLVHSQPKTANGGQVDFRFTWQAPADAGTVRFFVYSLGTNGNGQRSGDRPKNGIFDRVFGCEGQLFYSDEDEDGFGRDAFSFLACVGQPPSGFVPASGDCIDYDAEINPGATELCNLKDDDCNGETDENALPVMLLPDADGDGYYGDPADGEIEGEPVEGCVGLSGYAALGGDCYPLDEAIHPDAEEICNYYDENCDGEVDERSRAVCGVGWCARESPTCNADECKPGIPQPETCNLLDDDCDGQVDEVDDAALCPEGEDCGEGKCVPVGSLIPDGGAPSGNAGEPGTGATGTGATGTGATGTGATGTGATGGTPSPPRSTSKDSGCTLGGARVGSIAWLTLTAALLAAVRRRRTATR